MIGNNNARPGSTSGDTMGTRLPDVQRALRQEGIHTVIASYRDSRIALAFLGEGDRLLVVRLNQTHILHIVEVLGSTLKKRHPAALENPDETGTFEWDLLRDTLEHQHTTTYRGL